MYISTDVALVQAIHHPIYSNRTAYHTVKAQLVLFADALHQTYEAGNEAACIEIKNHHPNFLGKSNDLIMNANLILEDFQLIIAKEYGFKDWTDVVNNANISFNEPFELAVDHLLSGEWDQLNALLNDNPDLINNSSSYAHHAGLIHYVAANGIELWRQQIPHNLVEVTALLLQKGANPNQVHNIYNGQGNVLGLIQSSAHPYEAGIGDELEKLFVHN
ncbi:MAG: hypothetical protein AAFO07_03695 [Bacteroidota bacterium]